MAISSSPAESITASGEPISDGYVVGALKRGLLILNRFLAAPDQTLTTSDVARSVGIHRATAFRFLCTLVACGYLEHADRPGSYRLGSKCYPFQRQRPWSGALDLTSVPILKELADETGETSDVGVLHRGEAMLVQVVEGPQSVRARQWAGCTRPAHLTAIGKMLLASLPEDELERWLESHSLVAHTPNSITSTWRLTIELGEIRRRGYSVDDQEYELGLACIAAPIKNASARPVAAVAISGPSSRISCRIPELSAAAMRAAERLSRAFAPHGGEANW